MLKNYFKIAIRLIGRHKGYTFINVAGLAVGMAACMLIMLWVQHELSYDRFHQNSPDIYRVFRLGEGGESSQVTPPAMAPAIQEQISGIAVATRVRGSGDRMISNGEKSFSGNRFKLVDPEFFEIFSYPFIKGDPSTALDEPHSIVITEDVASKCFGDEDPIGKTLRLENTFDMQVTGVIGKNHEPSYLEFDLLVNTNHLIELWNENLDDWKSSSYQTYILSQEQADISSLSSSITALYNEKVPDNPVTCGLQPLTGIHLYGFLGEPRAILYVYIFSAIASVVLVIACINFINLTTARGAKRAREVAVRKVIGANRPDLVWQFLGESTLMSLGAFIAAVGLVELALPWFNQLTGLQLALRLLADPLILITAIGVVLSVGLLAGLTPAFVLSSYKPVTALKDSRTTGTTTRSLLRRALVLSQFTLSVFLIIGTVTIYSQLEYIRDAELGYDRDHIICLKTTKDHIVSVAPAFEELMSHAHIESATICGTLPGSRESSSNRVTWEGKPPDQDLSMEIIYASFGFQETFNLEMVQGRYYSPEFRTDLESGFVINEAAVRSMGFTNESVIGKQFSLYDKQGEIVGVVKDFHSQSLRDKIAPLIIHLAPYWNDNLVFRLSPTDVPATLAYMESVWKEHAPDYPFDYRFFDETLDALYKSEIRMGKVSGYLAGLAILISCLGLLGLASFMAEQRTKEIGVRKVLGSSVAGIVRLISREFVIMVIVSNAIAWPIAYFMMKSWLDNFAYHTELTWLTFALAGLGALVLALVTVAYHAVKAALANPVNALRYE